MALGLQSAGSVVVVNGLSCSPAYGIFPDQGSNLCPLHWQADSLLLDHQGTPYLNGFNQLGEGQNFFLSLGASIIFALVCEIIHTPKRHFGVVNFASL